MHHKAKLSQWITKEKYFPSWRVWAYADAHQRRRVPSSELTRPSRQFRVSIVRIALACTVHFAMPSLFSPSNGVRATIAEIPYWWCFTTQIWVVLLIGHATWEIWFNQSEALTRSSFSMEFQSSFLRRHLAGKPVVASQNVGCFLRLEILQTCKYSQLSGVISSLV